MAAADRCWCGSVAAGHRQGPHNGLVSGTRVQSAGLEWRRAWVRRLGTPHGVGPTLGAPVVGGVYRSTLGDYLPPLCSEVSLGRGGLALLCSVMVLGGSPLVRVAGF